MDTLDTFMASFQVISESVDLAKKALEAQELALTAANPAAKIAFELTKSAIKILLYKDTLDNLSDMVKGYTSDLSDSVSKIKGKVDSARDSIE